MPFRIIVTCWLLYSVSVYAQPPVQHAVSQDNVLRPAFSIILPPEALAGFDNPHPAPEHAVPYLALFRMIDGVPAALPVAMDYVVHGDTLTGRPFYPLAENNTFTCRRLKSGAGQPENTIYQTPILPLPTPAGVKMIYPATDSIPANTLLFYIHFSAPMAANTEAYRHVHIQADTTGSPEIAYAWRQRSYWMDSNQTLVVMIHPGRVKKGIHYAGPLLVAGIRYKISLDSNLYDKSKQYLSTLATKTFYVTAEDRTLPRILKVSRKVQAHARELVVLNFSEPMDLGGIMEGVTIFDATGNPVPVKIAFRGTGGRNVALTPVAPWEKGDYTIEFNARVTDLAANTLFRPFELISEKDQRKDLLKKTYTFKSTKF